MALEGPYLTSLVAARRGPVMVADVGKGEDARFEKAGASARCELCSPDGFVAFPFTRDRASPSEERR